MCLKLKNFRTSGRPEASYTHDGSETTSASFSYRASDGLAQSGVATVSITVTPANDAPVAVADSYTVGEGGSLSPVAPGVLVNDTDADGNPLTAVKVTDPAHGTLTLNSDGSFSYTHDGSETTSDSISYRASDGSANSNVAAVSITVTPGNTAPTLLPIAYRRTAEGTLIEFTLIGEDQDGDAITYLVDSLPGGATLDQQALEGARALGALFEHLGILIQALMRPAATAAQG